MSLRDDEEIEELLAWQNLARFRWCGDLIGELGVSRFGVPPQLLNRKVRTF